MSVVTPLDRTSWEPLYNQISERIRVMIDTELSPGDQIPSENSLMAQYNVSRNTVRLAIDSLIRQGLVYRVKGKGTFVVPDRWQFGLFRLVSFTEETRRRGMIPSSQLLGLTRIVPPEKISQSLYLDRGQEVFKIERLRLANERPMALNVSYLPCHLCPTLDHEDLVTGSIYQIIETNYNLHIGYAKQILKPVVANKAEAQLLQVKVGSPLLQVEGVAFLANGTPIEYASLIYRGDSYEFPIQAIRQSGQLLSKELG